MATSAPSRALCAFSGRCGHATVQSISSRFSSIVRVYSARGFGEKKLRDELYRRGVPRDYWDDALEQIQDSTEAIDAFLEKKLAGWTGDRKQLQKVTAALARRGFSWSDIRDALARYRPRRSVRPVRSGGSLRFVGFWIGRNLTMT